MKKVTSTKSITFPKLGWAISAGEIKELPEAKEAQERILSETEIKEVDTKINSNKSTTDKQ